MNRIILSAFLLVAPIAAHAQATRAVTQDVVEAHILPRFGELAQRAEAFAQAAREDCTPTSDTLRSAYGDAFDAWIAVSHLRFGPTEVDDRAFALAFWPDPRGATPRALGAMIAQEDPIAGSAADYAEVSIAARGFYAMEFLLYDEALTSAGDPVYRCTLVQTVSADIAATTQAILEEWKGDYAEALLTPSPDGIYRTDEEAVQQVYKALTTGLQFTSETRLGRPLGTFDRPRPTRAEVRRSGRSARHVLLSLETLQDLATRLSVGDLQVAAALEKGFARALAQLEKLDDPVFASVAEPQTRLKVEILQQAVELIRSDARMRLGPMLGVAAGFNALDGD